ncbi:hypothetical protein AYY26_15800 [Photobacterium phosphoreum]|uniref:hypothetical protein n=1 Tax=Photobacterium phosphoreum TaxID=659 RepID=UPI0007F946B8|nr:hypothetical protein [Photobacterium phosphoreum]OBU45545.1 hypothetical protein AYY26_15800 [Photobacterium phosphoreum]
MSQSILNSLPLYIGAISNDLNVDVTFSGSGAYCAPVGSKWQINIPLFDVDNAEARAAAYAYALHECGHINYTNFAVLKDLINTQKSKSEISLKKRISNIFEDTYIERELSKEYAGAYKRLSEMRTWLQDEDEKKNPDASNLPLSSPILNFIYTYSFFAANNYTCYKALLDENEVLLVEQLGNDAVLELKSVLNGVKQLASSQDCMDLTDRVYDILEKLKDVIQDQQQQQQQDQQGGDDSEDDTAQGDSDSGDSKMMIAIAMIVKAMIHNLAVTILRTMIKVMIHNLVIARAMIIAKTIKVMIIAKIKMQITIILLIQPIWVIRVISLTIQQPIRNLLHKSRLMMLLMH